ncbi:MAG TPA: ribosome biogenesis GTPase YlqF [Myxococcota bacterium]
MTIEWFPGHMATARREAGETMRRTDVVIEVLDARVPFSSASPLVEQLRTELGRPALKVLNKIDAADPATTTLWLEHYNAMPNTRAIGVSAKKKTDLGRIVKACLQLAPERGTRVKPLRLMILGIPNVGKSTLMNALLARHVANVGDEPAITRHQSQHTLQPGVTIVDTPGMLWPGLDQQVALKLAVSHSIGRNAYDDDTAAVFLAGFLLERFRPLLAARFTGLADDVVDAEGLLKHVAKRRGLVGNNADKAGLTLLNEFRSGKLGRITLETPTDTEGQRQQKATSAPVPSVPTTTTDSTTTTTAAPSAPKKAWSPAPATMKAEGKSLERKVKKIVAKKAARQAAKNATSTARPASRRR